MKTFSNYKKFLPYSDKVFLSIEWCHWFVLFNVFVSIFISIRYLLNINYNFTQFGYFYQIINLIGHIWFINFIVFLFLPFPFAFIITNEKAYKIFALVIAAIGQTLLLIDTQIFHYFKFHINSTLLQIFSENSDFHSGMNFNFLYILVPIIILIESVLVKYASHKVNKHETNWITKAIMAIFIGSFALTHILHVWADYTEYQPILVQDSTLPLSYPMTAKSFIAKNDWIMLPQANSVESTIGDLKYPLTQIKVAPNEVKKFNYLIVSVKGWNYDYLNSKFMPFTDRFSKYAQIFNNHYAANTLNNEAAFSLFYGLSPQYFMSTTINNVSPILIEELQREEYRIKTFINNETHDKTILDTSTFSTLRERIPETLNSDAETIDAVISFIQDYAHQSSSAQIPQFVYVSLMGPSLLKNESQISRFTPTLSHNEGRIISRKLDQKNIEMLRNAYANAIYSTDLYIEKLINTLNETNLKNNTIIILTGEYGFDLGLENIRNFGTSGNYTFSKLHVPLVVYDPSELPHTYSNITSHSDLAPTILEKYLGVVTGSSDYSTGSNIFQAGDGSEYVIAGDSKLVYIIDANQVTMINPRGNLTVTDSNNDHSIKIKMPTLLKVMRQLNKFYSD